MSRNQTEYEDCITPFQVEALGVRGSLVRLQKTVQDLTRGNRYPNEVTILLASTAALAGALACGIKYKGVFSLQVQGSGPVSLLLVDISSGGDLRGYAKFNGRALPKSDSSRSSVPRLLGTGYLAFTVDQGPDTNRYQGITELSGATLADCAQTYFRDSEQLETAVVLDSKFDEDSTLRAGAFMLQKMPQPPVNPKGFTDHQELWREAASLAATLKTSELIDPYLQTSDLLFRLFHERGIRLFKNRPVRHACRCSRKRVSGTLSSFPQAEVKALKDDGLVKVTCEFCNAEYVFNDSDISTLYDKNDEY